MCANFNILDNLFRHGDIFSSLLIFSPFCHQARSCKDKEICVLFVIFGDINILKTFWIGFPS